MKFNQNSKISQVKESSLIVGIDIGSTTQYARAFDWRGIELSKTFKFANSRIGFENFNDWLQKVCQKYQKTEIIAGLEPTGHYWFNLCENMKNNNITIAMVNPYHVKQTKELDDNSQTKNDIKDPKVIAKLVIGGRFSYPYIPEGIYADLRVADRCREKIVNELNSIKNRLHRWISIYFPEYKNVYSAIDSKSGLMILKETPLPKEIVELGVDGILKKWKDEKLRAVGLSRAKKLVEASKQSIGFTNGTQMAKLDIQMMIEDYEYKTKQLDTITEELESLCNEVSETKKLLEIKGVGIATVTAFVAEVGDIKRFKSAKQVQKYAGLSLIENSSGKHNSSTKISKRGRSRLRAILFRAAMPLIGKNEEFSEIYKYYITRTNSPLKKMQAVIAICCKLIRIFFTILTKGIEYSGKKLLLDIRRPTLEQVA